MDINTWHRLHKCQILQFDLELWAKFGYLHQFIVIRSRADLVVSFGVLLLLLLHVHVLVLEPLPLLSE